MKDLHERIAELESKLESAEKERNEATLECDVIRDQIKFHSDKWRELAAENAALKNSEVIFQMMPHIESQAQRDALIADCKADIEITERYILLSGGTPEVNSKLLRHRITLAALEAEPVAYVHPAYLQAGALGFDASVGRLAPAQVELYTAPLVPELKPVVLPEIIYTDHITTGKPSPALDYELTKEAIRKAGYQIAGEE